jgi:hypothetical protein
LLTEEVVKAQAPVTSDFRTVLPPLSRTPTEHGTWMERCLRSATEQSSRLDLTFDEQGFAYFATALGVQICDQAGRVVGIIRRPGTKDISNLVFGGADMQTLYATAIDKIYRRHLRRKGVYPWRPVALPKPRL